ncbi:hypothetical protein ACKAV7_003841 [Fusarium commune]
MWLERAGFPCNQLLIEEAANILRASRTPPAPPVGESWYRRFLDDNPQLQKKKLVRAFDRERAGFEAGDITDLEEFYTNLGVVVEERDIEASQMFNADECGIRISSLRERLEVIIVKKMLNTQHEVVAFSNRESSTMLGCANAAGYWFGCDEFMRDIDNPDFIWKEPFFERPEKQRIWRLLVIDGFTGKTSLEFGQAQRDSQESFTIHNIMNGFEKSGIFPVDGRGVIQRVKEKNKSLLATTNPALQSLLPKETRFKDAREVSRHLKRNYRDSFSSPTRDSFGILEDVVCEAVLLNSFAEEHIQTRLQRIAATNNKRNKERSLAASTKKDHDNELRRQQKNLKQLRREEDERLKEEWKNYKYDINNNGKPIHISFERWKKWKQLDIADEIIYIPPPSREASPNPQEGFFYDTSGSAQQKRFYERLRDATAAGFYRSPLQDIPAVPSSDGVEILLGNSQPEAACDLQPQAT